MKRKTAKRFFSTVLALIILLGIIPVSSFMSASASQTEVSAFNAADVINGLASDGNVVITLENDIDVQVDEY
ncbi:MAG: hypothetical protein J5662_05345, partial [Clostridia bacterium]|nr:hypothetical protein [Clostridia bacterium]